MLAGVTVGWCAFRFEMSFVLVPYEGGIADGGNEVGEKVLLWM